MNRILAFAATLASLAISTTFGAELSNMSLEDLLKQRSSLHRDSDTASGVSESIRDTPSSLLVIDQQTIQRRGYDSLDDVLKGLPGFDVITTNGTMQTVAYQRGYRTPWTQRTLFLINGKVDNNLWNHSAQISRQYSMNMIERVEILNGPAGAIYGPNAFLGVINVITKDASTLDEGESYLEGSLIGGSFESRGLDIAGGARWGEVSVDVGLKLYESDEADISDYSYWGYTDPKLLQDPDRWGVGIGAGEDPITGRFSPAGDLDVDGVVEPGERYDDRALGLYSDPTDNYGVFAQVHWQGFTFGYLAWETDEGYGPYYSFADGQANASWLNESRQYFLDHTLQSSNGLEVYSEVVYRESRVGGDWAESFGDWVSLSIWNSFSKAYRFEQKYSYQATDKLALSGGIKYERKDLTRNYIIDNYWSGSTIIDPEKGYVENVTNPLLAGSINSENPVIRPEPLPKRTVPPNNINETDDYGAYIQGIVNNGNWRFNGSLRWDENSDYGSVVNPRGALIYHANPETTLKLAYGEAFQEPSPKDLFGGWTGRSANENLLPETTRNLEFILTHQAGRLMHDVSIYVAEYENVIAGAQNVGAREILGFEYRGSYRFENPLQDSADITGSLYYTYTDAEASQQFNNATGLWETRDAESGDIAPHKINFDINVPFRQRWNFNLSANWVSDRELFSQNPLRADSNPDRVLNRKAESYAIADFAVLYDKPNYRISLKIENLFEEDYLLPGVEGAGTGDDFSVDVDGFQNSLIPQVRERTYTLALTLKL